MRNLGMFLDDATMSGLMSMYDDDGNGRITYNEFQGNDEFSIQLYIFDMFILTKLLIFPTLKDIVIDLGFKVSLDDAEDYTIDELSQNDGLCAEYTENVMQIQQYNNNNDGVITASAAAAAGSAHKGNNSNIANEKEEEKKMLMALSSIQDKNLREALAPFDVDGSGTIDLHKVREAAEGKAPGKLHWSDDRPMVGLAEHVKQVNHVAILVSDVGRSLKFYSQVMGFEQIRR